MKPAFYLLAFLISVAVVNAQTITWTAATNPHVVSGTYTVETGQTLVMEAGVIVNIQANSTLQVDGQLIGNGTAANRILIVGADNYSASIDVAGTADLKFTDLQTKIVPDTNGVLLFADCAFSSYGTVFNGSILQLNGRAPYLQFDRCTFQGNGTNQSASLYVAYATVVLRNTSFTNGSYCSVWPAYLYLDQVSSDHSTNFGLALGSDSDLFLNNITVTNATHGGLQLAGDTRNGTNVLIGQNVTLTGNEFPVHLTIAGLYAASNVPATGNVNNLIHVSDFAGQGGNWPTLAVPYFSDGSPLTVGGSLHIFPGVTVKMAPFSYISDIASGNGILAFGTKDQPIVFERSDPAQAWYDLHSAHEEGGRLRHTIVRGNSDGVNGGAWRLENCIFQNNGVGTNGNALVSGSQYLANTTGHYTGASSNLNGGANPNTFEGNGAGVLFSPDARDSWWGSPSGPRVPSNPPGTGDSVGSSTPYQPFLTARPNYTDAPPEVVLMRPSFQLDPNSKILLRWNATDDGTIVSQRIMFSPVGNSPASFSTVATITGNQRSYEWTVPNIGFTVNGANAFIKVVAVDNTGKESFDEAEIIIPTNPTSASVTWAITPGQTFTPGEMIDTVYTVSNPDSLSRVEYYLEDVRGNARKMFGRGANGLPFFSTDTARFVVAYGDTTNRCRFWYSPFFAIRPDAHLNDAPPVVTLTSPQPGQPLPPNSLVPVNWTASDDEGLRSFDILASYDVGRTWQPVVKDLPGTARSYDWQTPLGTGFANGVRVMVIAKDWRFQSTSHDGTIRPLAAVSAVSRKTHGSVGNFDINLLLSGEPGVECRSGAAGHTLIFSFSNNLVSGNATVVSGVGSVSGTPIFSANTMTVNLTGVGNAQKITVRLSNVIDSFSQVLADTDVSMNVLLGDTNSNKSVTASDLAQTKSQSGLQVSASNFREDVSVSGAINVSDIAAVKSASGTSVP